MSFKIMGLTANVFDIQRSSFYDGPGIRTTIFFKGCPLNCLWCHNPESQAYAPQLFHYFDKCTLCGKCVSLCDQNVHQIKNGIHSIDYEACELCGKCIEECDSEALKKTGSNMSVSEIMDIVLADKDFYEKSGGGITLSGGEPLLHFDFAMVLLETCKKNGINTCVETSGFIAHDKFKKILEHIDVLLFDYKITNTVDHKKYTGVSNQVILKNLDLAYQSQMPVILRCPIIEGINDTEEHFQGIAMLDKKYPKLKGIELLPYHTIGNNKRLSIGRDKTLQHLETTSQELAAKWLERLKKMNISNVKIGWV